MGWYYDEGHKKKYLSIKSNKWEYYVFSKKCFVQNIIIKEYKTKQIEVTNILL